MKLNEFKNMSARWTDYVKDEPSTPVNEAVHGIEVGQTVTHKQDPEKWGKGRVVAAMSKSANYGNQPVILVMWENGKQQRHDPRLLKPEGGYAVRETEAPAGVSESANSAAYDAFVELGGFLAKLINEGYDELAKELDQIVVKLQKSGVSDIEPGDRLARRDSQQAGLGEGEEGRYFGSDPEATGDPALDGLADLQRKMKEFATAEGENIPEDALAYIDDAVRNLHQAMEDVRYRAEISEDTKRDLSEGDFIGHHAEIDGKTYVDSNFLNSVRKIRDTFPSSLESMGFGEFYLKTPKGRIDFDRSRGKEFPGMVGRSHQLYAEPPELADELIDAMERAGASETPLPSEEPPPGLPAQEAELEEKAGADAKLAKKRSEKELPRWDQKKHAGKEYSKASRKFGKQQAKKEKEEYEATKDEGVKISREDFVKIVHEEIQDELKNHYEPEESSFTMDELRNMVREEVGGLINNYKTSLEEGDDWYSDEHETLADKKYADSQAVESTGDPKEDAIREIVASQSMSRVEGVKLDLYSASAIVQVLDALSPQNKEKYMQLPVDKMAQMAFKMMG